MDSLDATKPEWSLEQVKGQRLEGHNYAIEIDKESPQILLLFARKNDQWVEVNEVLIFDVLRIPNEMDFPLTKEEYEILSKSKIKVDKLVEDLASFDAEMYGELYESTYYYDEEDLDVVIGYLKDPKNKPFDGQNLPDETQDILAHVLRDDEEPLCEDDKEKTFRDKLIQRHGIHQNLVREEIVALLKAGQMAFDFAKAEIESIYQELTSETYQYVRDMLIGALTAVDIKRGDERVNKSLIRIRESITKRN